MPEIRRDGWTLFYEDSGGDGPPVLLIHGLLMDRTMFAPQVEALRDRYRLITPDLRGHGDSSHGGVKTYELDNEPTLWNSTHRDVHPQPLTYDELWQKSQATASAATMQEPAFKMGLLRIVPSVSSTILSAPSSNAVGTERPIHPSTITKTVVTSLMVYPGRVGIHDPNGPNLGTGWTS